MSETTISLEQPQLALPLFGPRDQHLRVIRETLGVNITHRDGAIRVAGDDAKVAQAVQVLEQLKGLVLRRGLVAPDDVALALAMATGDESLRPLTPIDIVNSIKQIRPRTPGQAAYAEAIRKHDVIVAVGPAGTGKTYLAVALAVEALKHHQIRKIVLVRPAVEAGESLGFLPGDLQAKINPYLRPLLDALHEMVDYDEIKLCMEQQVIEVAPLAYMRGRTLNDAFVILDEAQNTTVAQMKMFLTRMGEGSKMVVSGDPTQIDLPPNSRSGLIDALTRLAPIQGVAVVRLTTSDIVRHRLVQEIVNAYETPSNPPASQ
ncbi:PhoH family protein [Lignipirellula cremea]|uniref:PhoH-like protein n=1 Tax=Lignipirellula cremea TaxID=2528010 RepID=A0A518E223_9BACT|nr:PhoH family protein [Lignipirellula cremea]QDU98145.1 PhoH-like protein [Lignipirellula cremea]